MDLIREVIEKNENRWHGPGKKKTGGREALIGCNKSKTQGTTAKKLKS
jgi:hypothetical protein